MSTSVKKGYMTIAHVIIMFALMFIIGNLQPFGTVTPMGMDILGIFVGTLYGWLFLDLAVAQLNCIGGAGYDRLYDCGRGIFAGIVQRHRNSGNYDIGVCCSSWVR